jgi:Zn-dependent protease with chaperone function
MVFMFFEHEHTRNIGLFFILLNFIFAVLSVCIQDGRFRARELLRLPIIIALFALGCLLFPIGTVALGMWTYGNFKKREI